jgi:hypothetical protein
MTPHFARRQGIDTLAPLRWQEDRADTSEIKRDVATCARAKGDQ